MRYYNVANLNWNELSEWKHTNSIRLSQSVNRRTDNYSGIFIRKKVKISLNCSYSHFTDVSADQTELSKFQQRFLKTIGEEKNETKLFEDSVRRLTYSSDPLKTNFDTLYIQSINTEKLNKLYKRHFCNPAEFTFIFTGPMPVKDAVPLIEKYLASIAVNHHAQEKILEYKDPELNRGKVELFIMRKHNNIEGFSIYHLPYRY